jgi:hypothetical protein
LGAQPFDVRELIGEFGLAAALVRQGEQIDHEPTGFLVG